jgi:hypothetical protein
MLRLHHYIYNMFISAALISLSSHTNASSSNLTELESESYPYKKIVMVGLFSGNDPISKGIGVATQSEITHVCAVVEQEEGELLCYESMPHSGVRLMSWDKRVREYEGNVSVARIQYDEGEEPSAKDVTESILKHLGKKYQKNLFNMALAISKSNEDEDNSDTERLFCSEHLALTFEDIGLFAKGVTLENYVPADFAKPMTLRNATLGTPELIHEYERGGALGCLQALSPKKILADLKMAIASLKGIS